MTDPAVAARAAHYALTRSAQTLIGICSGLVADGKLNEQEVSYLRTWLAEHADVAAIWPGSVIAARIEQIMSDGVISDEEQLGLIELLTAISGNEFAETGSSSAAGPCVPYDDVDITFNGMRFCLTGTFFYGTRAKCERELEKLGATPVPSVTSALDFLVVGGGCSPDWANETYGRKIQTAIERKRRYGRPAIISERMWNAAMTLGEGC